MTDSPYKCTEHKLDFACLGCVRAHIAKEEKLLEFVDSLTKRSCCNQCECISCDALQVLRKIGEVSSWISVRDRLPDKEDRYLTIHCKIVDITDFRLTEPKGWHRGLGYLVTHWMPLPEPPK